MSAIDAVVLVAMPDEEAPFLALASEVGPEHAAGVGRTVTLAGRRVLLVRTGIGLVNAAAALAVVLRAHDGVPLVISAGTAGGLGSGVRVGDVVVGSDYLNTDADARAFGYAFGQTPRMPAAYPVSADLLAAFDDLPPGLPMLHRGLLVSSDGFVGAERAAWMLGEVPSALAADMESAALAQVAHTRGVPFVSVRGVSDLCGPASQDDFLTHVDDAAERSAAVVLAVLPRLS